MDMNISSFSVKIIHTDFKAPVQLCSMPTYLYLLDSLFVFVHLAVLHFAAHVLARVRLQQRYDVFEA